MRICVVSVECETEKWCYGSAKLGLDLRGVGESR